MNNLMNGAVVPDTGVAATNDDLHLNEEEQRADDALHAAIELLRQRNIFVPSSFAHDFIDDVANNLVNEREHLRSAIALSRRLNAA
jgi:hypothetical protein